MVNKVISLLSKCFEEREKREMCHASNVSRFNNDLGKSNLYELRNTRYLQDGTFTTCSVAGEFSASSSKVSNTERRRENVCYARKDGHGCREVDKTVSELDMAVAES